MGVLQYANRWARFLTHYDHWRLLMAEFNKLLYVRTYLERHSEGDQLRTLHHGVRWLLKSMEQGRDAGSGTFYFNSGWTSSYPETTGYIIPTLLKYADSPLGEPDWSQQAVRAAKEAGDWLLSIQREDGGWPGGYVHQNRPSVVFNTGQILRGTLSLYEHTGEERYKLASLRAIEWIWDQLNEEGQFATSDFMGAIRVYGTYVVAPILEWSVYFKDQQTHWKNLAIKHLNWVLTQQNELGWFANCDNTLHHNDRPIIHTLAYTIDGLWDCATILKDEQFQQRAVVPARYLATEFLLRGMLNGRYNLKWEGSEAFITTGGAQLAIIWHKIFLETGEAIWKDARDKMNVLLSVIAQRNARESDETAGGIAGSFPIWGRYEPFALPNWATKYLVDSLLNARIDGY